MKQSVIADNGGRDDVDYRYTLKFRVDSREAVMAVYRYLEETLREGHVKVIEESRL